MEAGKLGSGGELGARVDLGQGILPFSFETLSDPMDLTARAGLALVSEAMLALGLDEIVHRRLRLRRRRRGYDEFDKLQAVILIQAAGGECVEDVGVLARDAGLVRLLDRPLPSADVLHDFLGAFHREEAVAKRPAEGAFIPEESDELGALAKVNEEWVARAVEGVSASAATLDLDATIIESHKRAAQPHYKGGRGYQPTAVLWAEQDLVVADQFRDGNVPAGMRTPEVAERALRALPAGATERRFRADSACYDEALLKALVGSGVAFTISADMSPQLHAVCTHQDVVWKLFEERGFETVETAEIEFTPGDWPRSAAPLRYIAMRFCGSQRSLFHEQPKHLAVVTNRREVSAPDLVRWHWGKAGTIELVHDVTKNDLAAGVMPSGKFGANAAWYRLNLLTYNVLTVLRRRALPERFRNARPKRLRYEIFTVPAEIRFHARQLTARLGATRLTVEELVAAREKLRDLQATIQMAVSPV